MKASIMIWIALWVGAAGCGEESAAAGHVDGDLRSQVELERIADEVQLEVEDIRGLEFKRPVAVELSDKEGFVAYATERLQSMTPPEKLAGYQDVARHLGMIPPDMDLSEVTMEVLREQAGGFYDPPSETFYLMEAFTGDSARVILAHELGHALDDQHFDLDAGYERTLHSTDAATAYQSIVEGSGMVVMTRYTLRHAGDFEMDDLVAASSAGTETLAAAPAYIWKPLMGPYQKGQSFLEAGYQMDRKAKKALGERADPNDNVDAAFRSPPLSTEQILHPDKYWSEAERDEPRAIRHAVSALPEGWQELHRDVLGELILAIFATPFDDRATPDLGDPVAALGLKYTSDAAAGWGGDEVLVLGSGDARIVSLATVWDSPEDAREFAEAAQALAETVSRDLTDLADGEIARSGFLVRPDDGAPDRVRVIAWSRVADPDVEGILAKVLVEAE